jgi:hypothetical protein
VIANWAISAFWLKEGLRLRDVFGVALVVLGVVLIIVFVPKDPVGGTLNLLPCPIAFVLGNVSEHTCEYPASWPIGDTFSSPHASGVAVCETRGLLAVGSIYFYFVQPIWLVFMCLSLALLAWLLVYTRESATEADVTTPMAVWLPGGTPFALLDGPDRVDIEDIRILPGPAAQVGLVTLGEDLVVVDVGESSAKVRARFGEMSIR